MRQDVFRKQWDSILCDAISKKASDIHLEPLCGQATITYQLRFRIHGVLRVVNTFEEQCGSLLIDWLKNLSGLNIADRELPQDGRLTVGNADFRVSILPCLGGEKAVLRVLRNHHRPRLHELNLPTEAEQALRKALTEKSGLIVIAGATGSGKTTTIHALLSELDSTKTNIMSLEDPVEYRFNGLSQIQISKHITFATGLRALLRQDPDVIFVGECRDSETAQLALEAAGTGHLVLTTVHTGCVEDISKRFEKLGCEREVFDKLTRFKAHQSLILLDEGQKLNFEWSSWY